MASSPCLCPATRRDQSVSCRRFTVMKPCSCFIVSQPVGWIRNAIMHEHGVLIEQNVCIPLDIMALGIKCSQSYFCNSINLIIVFG